MSKLTSLQTRVRKARNIQDFVGVLTRDKEDRIKTVLVPGSQGKQYHVIIRRHDSVISTECRLQAGRAGYKPCPGNSNGHVCYHSISAIVKAAEGFQVSFSRTPEAAKKVSHFNSGKIGRLASWQGTGRLFIVFSREE